MNLEIEEGECFGLLGPNGAGKTTLIRMLIAASPPTEGHVWILGKDLQKHAREIKAVIGVVPQMDNLDPDLSVLQNLLAFARYFDIPRKEAHRRSLEVLTLFELQNRMSSQIRELSGGMRRRLLLARGLLNQPKVIVLDEPSIGLDPQARYLVWQKLTELKSQGVTRLLCTQNMDEAALLCDRVAIMHLGKILNIDTPQKLVERYGDSGVVEIEVDPASRAGLIRQLKERGYEYTEIANHVHVFTADSDAALQGLVTSPLRLRRRQATLEDIFFRLTGRSLLE